MSSEIRLSIPVHLFIFLSALFSAQADGAGCTEDSFDSDFHSTFGDTCPPQQIEAGWLSMVNGKDPYGWRNTSGWQNDRGVVQVSQNTDQLLRTGIQFDDFELKLKYQLKQGSNVSLLVRSSPRPGSNDAIEIPLAAESFDANHWHELSLVADGENVLIWNDGINKKNVISSLRKGYIAIRIRAGSVRLKRLDVRPLHLYSLLDQNSRTVWDTSRKLESEFRIENKTLRMTGGRGQLETNKTFANFIFSMHARTNAEGLNSGIFFRCIPGEMMNGYESQISNTFLQEDRTKPSDCGTGGIFRRCNARWVNADDKSWFAKTIIADGGTFFVWVNGILVCDWTDQRKPSPNPRKGRRLDAGSIILQGHDPTTDISFRNMKVRELNDRRINLRK